MMRKFNLFSEVYTMGYLWDLNFTIEYFFYSRIFYILQYIINWLNRYTHLSVTEYIKERC